VTRPIAQAIRHVAFEDLGSFAEPIEAAGYGIEYIDAAHADLEALDPLGADLLVVLGGPVGAYDGERYPVLSQELAMLQARLSADRPTLGVCLGAQLMATALGARVYPGPVKEIGWSPLELTGEGEASPLAELQGVQVLHWHGDTFDLPHGCHRLASTAHCRQQAFARGSNILGLQFHAEVMTDRFEHWLIGHAFELADADIDPARLRSDAARWGPTLERRSKSMIAGWLEEM
jgi:GMP synthase (glutamine-hydrolysing)